MNWFRIAHNIRSRTKNFDTSMRTQVAVIENQRYVLLLSDYKDDEFIRITDKEKVDVYYYRPFNNESEKKLEERLLTSGFGAVIG